MTKAASLALALVALVAVSVGHAQSGSRPPYLDPDLPFERRAADLVSRMTVEEKISQVTNDAAAIPRLQVPAYEWWNECLHGVARAGAATVFPQAIGLAASFDEPLMTQVASVIADEGRAKHHEFAARGQRGRYQGLTFWSPNINIFRDPRWGRGMETYGEDPYLTARMGVRFVQGLQGDDPRYFKVIATAKHFAVHSGPEPERHTFDVRPSERDLWETYLPAFQALVQEGKAYSVMGAYNRINGESGSASQRLLQDILRKQWGFEGYVVSDCGAIDDIYKHHKIVATQEEAAALGVTKGCDLECGATYKSLGAALSRKLLTEADLDLAVKRLMLARLKLGMFDPPERVRYAKIPYSVNEAPEHGRLARRMAQESIVLLKNDGLLPLSRKTGTIAVVGPNADELMTLLGNYYGTPSKPVTALAGIRQAVDPSTKVLFARGTELVEGRQDPRAATLIDATSLRPAAGSSEHGLKGEYFKNRELQGPPALTRVDPRVDFRWYRGAPTSQGVARGEIPPDQALPNDEFSVRWTGQLVPPSPGATRSWPRGTTASASSSTARRSSRSGQSTRARSRRAPRWTSKRARPATCASSTSRAFATPRSGSAGGCPGPRSLTRKHSKPAGAADVVVFVGGLTGDVEGEEMSVSYPGFAGGDRTDIALPAPQEKLLKALHATGKPIVLVLMAGSAISMEWAQKNLPAILMAWYPGQEGGAALADVLFGDVSPAGRLPVTFYKSVADLPPFANYDMKGRTYRYFSGEPLYPFGYGLSYTRFEYSGLRIDKSRVGAGDPLTVAVKVKNAGKRAGDEVVQLYVRHAAPKLRQAVKSLRGFERVPLAVGEERELTFRLVPAKDFAHYDEAARKYAVEPGPYEVQVGASSKDIRLVGPIRVD